jgi:hypothetical protein
VPIFLLPLGVPTISQDQGRSAARKIQRIAMTIAMAKTAGQNLLGARC